MSVSCSIEDLSESRILIIWLTQMMSQGATRIDLPVEPVSAPMQWASIVTAFGFSLPDECNRSVPRRSRQSARQYIHLSEST